ncbi:MAG: hypothetical protein J0M16_03265 [Gammaproteobacteria bacterium]|nr:hypothetical protein [Gammaproteobacteria bacterium]
MQPTIKTVSGTLAVALAGIFAGTAQAAIPAVSASFYISGASAARAIPPAIATELCDPAINDRADYIDNAASINYRINVCTLKNDASVPTSIRGLKVAFYSRSQGGTLFGIRGIAIPQAIKFIDGSSCPADDGNPATQQICATLTADADYEVPDGTGDGHVPAFGLSDEEPIFGCEVAKENGPAQCTAAEVAALKSVKVTAAPVYQLPWTIQASSQLATELGGNISSVVLSGIFAGNYQSVADIKSAMGVAPLAGDDTEGLKVCRRTNTSGTQAGHSHIWLGSNYCGSATKSASFVDEAFDDNNVANGWPANYDIVENSSSSNVENCVIAAGDEGRSIGINSLENAPKPGAVDLKIDGITPSQQTAALGAYRWYAESTLNSNSDVINNVAALNDFINADLTARATTTQRSQFRTLFLNNVRNPLKIVASGLNGINALPNFSVPTDPFNPATPVGWTTKNVGVGGSNCKSPLPVFP